MVRLAAVRPCKGSSGTEVLPEGELELDLVQCARRLEAAGYEVMDASVLLIVDGDVRITLYPTGRMLAHTSDLDRARAAALDLLRTAGVE